MTDKELLWNPNQNARPSAIRQLGPIRLVDGYQRYVTTTRARPLLPLRRNLLAKSRVVVPFLKQARASQELRSIADFGCNTGYFLTAARALGFSELYGYDLDDDVKPIFDDPLMSDITFDTQRVQDVSTPADVTIAISLFHWLVGQASNQADPVDEVLAHFAAISNEIAVIELVTSDDPLVKKHQHYEQDVNASLFVDRALRHFASADKIGESAPTRLIYALRTKS